MQSNIQKKLSVSVFGVALLGLCACNDFESDIERGAIGAALGCIAGEVLVDGRCVEGAVIGGAGGILIDDL